MRKTGRILVLLVLTTLLAAASWAQAPAANPRAAADTAAAQTEKPKEVQLRVDTAFAYCALEMTGSYDQHQAAFEKLFADAMQQGIYGGTPFGVYWNSPADTPVEKLKWEVGFSVPAGQVVKEPLKLKTWKFTTMAVLDYSGEFEGEGMTKAYGDVFKWIGEHGYKPAGPVMERYLNVPSPNEKGVLIGRVEITVPVEKAPVTKEKQAK